MDRLELPSITLCARNSPLEAALDESVDGVGVDVLLHALHLVHVVVGERLVGAEPALRLAGRLRHADLAGVDDLAGQLRPEPHGHADAAPSICAAALGDGGPDAVVHVVHFEVRSGGWDGGLVVHFIEELAVTRAALG